LTKADDRLIALDAVIQRIEKATNSTLLFGVLSRSIPRCLGWRVKEPRYSSRMPRIKTTNLIVPSWSWVGLETPVDLDLDERNYEPIATTLFDLASAVFSSPLSDQTARSISTAAIKIYGLLLPTIVMIPQDRAQARTRWWWNDGIARKLRVDHSALRQVLHFDEYFRPPDIEHDWAEGFSYWHWSFWPDLTGTEQDDIADLYVLPLYAGLNDFSSRRIRWRYKGLLIRKSETFPNAYERLGFMSFDEEISCLWPKKMPSRESVVTRINDILRQRQLRNGVDLVLV